MFKNVVFCGDCRCILAKTTCFVMVFLSVEHMKILFDPLWLPFTNSETLCLDFFCPDSVHVFKTCVL